MQAKCLNFGAPISGAFAPTAGILRLNPAASVECLFKNTRQMRALQCKMPLITYQIIR